MLKTLDYSKIVLKTPEQALDFCPDENFDWHAETAEDWFPEWCDDCNTWHKNSYPMSFSRADGVLTVTLHCVDADGNWDVAAEYRSDEPEYWNEFYRFCFAPTIYENFRAWYEYCDWVLDNDLNDVLGEFDDKVTEARIAEWRDDYKTLAEREIRMLTGEE